MDTTRRLIVDPHEGVVRPIGVWLYALADQRARTLRFVEGLTEDELDRAPSGAPGSIGSLLFHLAATDMSWLFEDVLGTDDLPPEVRALLPWPYRDDAGRLWPVTGETLSAHRTRLAETRRILEEHVRRMNPEEFRRVRTMPGYVVTPEWILYHLLEHEAHHAGQIRLLARLGHDSPDPLG